MSTSARRATPDAPAAGAVPRPRGLVAQPLRAGLRRHARGARLALRGAAFSRLLGRAEPGAARLPLGRLRRGRLDARAAARAARRAAVRGRRLARRQCAAALGRGSRRDGGARRVRALAAVSSPLDLTAGGHAIGRGFNRLVYTRMFLRTMKPKALAKLAQHPGPVRPRAAARGARPVRVRQRLHRAAARLSRHRRLLVARARPSRTCARIRIPALVLNARNDPFVPGSQPAAAARGRPPRHAVAAGARRPRRLSRAALARAT